MFVDVITNNYNSMKVIKKMDFKSKIMGLKGTENIWGINPKLMKDIISNRELLNDDNGLEKFIDSIGERRYNCLLKSDLFEYDEEGFEKKQVLKSSNNDSVYTNSRCVEFVGYNDWKRSVINRDRKCVVCGYDKNLQVHHLFGYAENKLLATVVSNGVTLCKHCHRKYHEMYGVKNINPIDFMNFVKKFSVG